MHSRNRGQIPDVAASATSSAHRESSRLRGVALAIRIRPVKNQVRLDMQPSAAFDFSMPTTRCKMPLSYGSVLGALPVVDA
jgi:hypothetical protein